MEIVTIAKRRVLETSGEKKKTNEKRNREMKCKREINSVLLAIHFIFSHVEAKVKLSH